MYLCENRLALIFPQCRPNYLIIIFTFGFGSFDRIFLTISVPTICQELKALRQKNKKKSKTYACMCSFTDARFQTYFMRHPAAYILPIGLKHPPGESIWKQARAGFQLCQWIDKSRELFCPKRCV